MQQHIAKLLLLIFTLMVYSVKDGRYMHRTTRIDIVITLLLLFTTAVGLLGADCLLIFLLNC